MISAEEFININKTEEKETFRIGTVAALFANNTAQVTIDGETTPSEKQYSYLASYVPAITDRVILATVAGTYIILGKISFNVAPNKNGSFVNLTVTGDTKLGNKLGFFGQTPVTKWAVSDPSAIVTTQTAGASYTSNEQTMLNNLKTDATNQKNKLAELIDHLQYLNLV